MGVQVGDIVVHQIEHGKTDRWVVAELLGGPHGHPQAKIVRYSNERTGTSSLVIGTGGLEYDERPTFNIDQAVKVGDLDGLVKSGLLADWTVKVLVEEYEKLVTGEDDVFITVAAGYSYVPLWLLVLENVL